MSLNEEQYNSAGFEKQFSSCDKWHEYTLIMTKDMSKEAVDGSSFDSMHRAFSLLLAPYHY